LPNLYLTELGNFAAIPARALANIPVCYTNDEDSIPSYSERLDIDGGRPKADGELKQIGRKEAITAS
jgi:hypothetical protein